MYSRSYYADEGRIQIPENYDGTSLIEKSADKSDGGRKDEVIHTTLHEGGRSEIVKEQSGNAPRGTQRGFLPLRIPDGGIFGKDFLRGLFSDFGTEELIIIGLALFMLLSSDGDIECAVMLLILLFIGKGE